MDNEVIKNEGKSNVTAFLLNSGHGEDTLGKRSPFVPAGVIEYTFNRSVVMNILDIAESENLTVVHIDPEYEAVPLAEIVRRANDYYANNSDCIFIAVHANAAPGGDDQWMDDVHGATVLVSPRASQTSRVFWTARHECDFEKRLNAESWCAGTRPLRPQQDNRSGNHH